MGRFGRIAVFLVFASSLCHAQIAGSASGSKTVLWPPTTIDLPDALPQPTVSKELIDSLRIADFPVTLEKTKLEDARKRFGATTGDRGDAGDSEAWLCLQGSDAHGPWIFWLTSGEIDGPAIGGFQWRRLARNETPDHHCPRLCGSEARVSLPLSIHPGMTEAEARKVLGAPTMVRGNTLIFFHEHHEIIDNLPYTSDNLVTLVIQNGAVLAIAVSKTTSS
jgi:hypothetical protein